jgi:hypothetical protein
MTDLDALTNDWATDPAVLKRLLGLLHSWGEPAAGPPPMTQPQHTAGHPEFGVTCRRANPTDPLDLTLPATLPRSDRPPVCLPAACRGFPEPREAEGTPSLLLPASEHRSKDTGEQSVRPRQCSAGHWDCCLRASCQVTSWCMNDA